MAKKSIIERNAKRTRLAAKYAKKRAALKALIHNKQSPINDRFQAQLELASLPRNGSRTRIRERCLLTGRGRGCYRKFKISRIVLRSLANKGELPGVTKASW